MKRERQLVGTDLRGCVWRLSIQRMLLGDGNEARRSVHFAGGGVDDLRHSKLPRRLQHVQRPLDVGLDVGVGRMIGVRYGNQGGEMEHYVASSHSLPDAVRIPDVAREDIERGPDVLRRRIEPTP